MVSPVVVDDVLYTVSKVSCFAFEVLLIFARALLSFSLSGFTPAALETQLLGASSAFGDRVLDDALK